jgi:hypothetical protein
MGGMSRQVESKKLAGLLFERHARQGILMERVEKMMDYLEYLADHNTARPGSL